ncbi:MAG: F0F1 ATP synthase subunit B [Thermoleophilia bacterium]|nr:F0F1 ATP synthase subunit B [Thermoleophilia bacterium]
MLTLIAAVSEKDEISPILAPYPGLMFWTIVAFALALFILKKYAFGPIQEMLDKRRAVVNSALENAEKVKAEAEAVLADYKQQLAEARTESDAIVARARTTGDELTARIKAEGEAQRQEQLTQTQTQIRAEVDKAVGDIRTAVAELTVTAAEKVLRGSLDTAQHHKLIEDAVSELDFDRLQKVGASS